MARPRGTRPKTPAADPAPETTREPDSEPSPEKPPRPLLSKTVSRLGVELVLDRYASSVGTGRAMTAVDFEAMRKELLAL